MPSVDDNISDTSQDSKIKETSNVATQIELTSIAGDNHQEQQQQYRVYPVRFYGLTLIALLNIGSSLSWLCVAPIPEYAQTFFNGTSLTAINWLSNMFMLVFIFIGPLSSFVYDRHSIKMGLVVGATLQSVGSWLRFFSSFVQQHPNRLALALIGQIICALGQPFFLSAATPYAALWFAPDERGAASTVAGLANAVGMALASLIMPAVVTNASEMWLGFLIVACINTAFAIPTIFIPRKPNTPPSYSASNSQERQLPLVKSLWLLFTNYNFLILLLAFGVLAGLFSTVASLLTQFVTPYGVSVDDAGYLAVALIVAGIVGAVATGIFIDKTKLHKVVLKLYVPVLACMQLAMLYEVKFDNYVPLIIVCAIYGFFAFSLLPIALELSVECSYPVSESVSSPLLWLASQICGLIFLSSMDALRDDNGDPPGNMRQALVMAVGLSMPMILFAWLYNSRNKRMESEGGYQEPQIFPNLYSKLIRRQ